MSDSVDALLAGEEDVGDYDLRDDEEDALLEEDDNLDTTKDNEYPNEEEVVDDVLELNIEETLNEEEEQDLSYTLDNDESNHRTKFINERTENIAVKVTPNSNANYANHSNHQRHNNMNINNRGNFRGRAAYRGNNRGRGNMRPQNIQNRNMQQKRLPGGGAKKCFLNPHFKGNIKSNTWGNKPVIPIQPWANNPPAPVNNFQQPPPLVPSLPPVVVHNQSYQNMRQITPSIQELPPQIHQRPPVHQRLGFNQPPINTFIPPRPPVNFHQERQVTIQPLPPMNQMMPPPNLHMNNPPPNNPLMMFNQPPIYNQPPPPIYQPNTYNSPPNYSYQQCNNYHQQHQPPMHHQEPLYNHGNDHYNSYEHQPQINNYPVENNFNNQMQQHNQWDNVEDHSFVPPQSHNMQNQAYDHNQPSHNFHKNRKFINNFQKRRNERREGYEDNVVLNKRRSFENKVLQEVPTVNNLAEVNLTVTVTQPEVEEDEETKKYRIKIEEQKKMRERILAQKEQRRKLAVQKKLEEEESHKVVPPATIPTKSVVTNKVVTNPNIKIIKPNESLDAENKVEKERLMSFLNNRTIFAKDQSLVDTSVVVVSNLAAGTSEVKLRKLGQGVGDIQKFELSPKERQATIQFKSVASAHAFFKKYQRYMLDLSVINVTLKPI